MGEIDFVSLLSLLFLGDSSVGGDVALAADRIAADDGHARTSSG